MGTRLTPRQLGVGDETVPKGDLFDHVGIVAGAAEPLIDDIDEADVIGAVQLGVHQVGAVDVEDDVAGWAVVINELCHGASMTEGCDTVVSDDEKQRSRWADDHGSVVAAEAQAVRQ